MARLMEMLHVLAAFWFVAGLVGRNLALVQAGRARDIGSFQAVMQLAGLFERLMVIPGSTVVLLLGLGTAWAQGWPRLGLLPAPNANWLFLSVLLALTMIPLVPLIFLPTGRIYEAARDAAVTRGEITPALSAALRDRTVAIAHAYEMVAVLLIIALMVTKPF
jgi:hypothetical protein